METSSSTEPREQVAEFLHTHQDQILIFVFTDIVNSTAISKSGGDRALIMLIQEHRALIREVLKRNRSGREVETAGDSFFLVFTTASDAVRFALQAQAGMRALAERLKFPLQIRIGIHLGELFAPDPTVTNRGRLSFHSGEKNTAARVMSLAAGGQILLSRTPYDSAKRALHKQVIEGIDELE